MLMKEFIVSVIIDLRSLFEASAVSKVDRGLNTSLFFFFITVLSGFLDAFNGACVLNLGVIVKAYWCGCFDVY